MDALTLLLIVDMCNREQQATEQYDRPALYQPYKQSYPHIVSPAALDENNACFAYKKPAWAKI